MNSLLIVILVILGLSLLFGYLNGFLKTIFSLISWIIVLVVCNIATPMVTQILIEQTEIDTTIQNVLDAKIDEMISSAMSQIGAGELTEVIPGDITMEDIMSELPPELQAVLPDDVKHMLENVGNNIGSLEGFSLDAQMIDTSGLVNSIMGVLSLLIVMVVVRVVLLIVELALGIASKIPLIGPLDKILGLACGAAKGLIWSWVILAIVAVLALTGVNTEFAGYISESQILTWLQENNLILNLIS